ncbi:unnamed protein product [Pseudo-nitzschia multistriata]|uniref:Uncharacterized protein n=1 Tax=Pseudo-nitzschia multistriata TaxID=183589 RepID=A0A448ZQK8_9STRA|nr:unnamed protein product [Pseudo-nitzschia multistriata]VEU44341.1 unnamed protein product [Pseudo-nitzschia multistriata]
MTCPDPRGFLSSTRTSTVLPRYRLLRSSPCFTASSWTRARRSFLTASGTTSSLSSVHVAASVLGRGEYANELRLSNFTASIRSSVRWKASSVSPGNPTITSAVMAASGDAARILLMIFM